MPAHQRLGSRPFKVLIGVAALCAAGVLALIVTSMRTTAFEIERSEFFAIVEYGTPPEAERFLARGWSANERERHYQPAGSFLAQIQRLFTTGSSQDMERPVLFAAVKNRKHRIAMMRLLLDRGADVTASMPNVPMVNYAISYGDKEAVELLLDRGAHMPRDDWPIGAALWRPNYEMIKLLVERGAKIPTDWRRQLKERASSASEAERHKIALVLGGAKP